MAKAGKAFIIGTVLVLPVLIFLFLKFFGENKFDVPVMHPEGLPFEDCGDTSVPYKVPVIDSLSLLHNGFTVVLTSEEVLSKEELNEVRRLSQSYSEVNFIMLLTDPLNQSAADAYIQENWKINLLKSNELEELNRCGFGNIGNEELILIDDERRVRGYYDLDEKKELDRLEGEIKILLE